MKECLNKKLAVYNKKKLENEKFFKVKKGNQKHDKYVTILMKKKKTNDTPGKNKIKINKTDLNEFPDYNINLIKKNTFLNSYNFIKKKGANNEVRNMFYDSYILYCNFDLPIKNNMTKYYNLPIDIEHSYYSDVVLFVYDNKKKWKDIVIKKKMKEIKKVINIDKFVSKCYKDDLLKEFTSNYDMYLFDSTIRAKKYYYISSRVKKNHKCYTSIKLKEETFYEDFQKIIKKTYADIKKASTHSVPIGYLYLGPEKLYENIKAIEKFMLSFYTQKKINILSINLNYMKMTIPIYVTDLYKDSNSPNSNDS